MFPVAFNICLNIFLCFETYRVSQKNAPVAYYYSELLGHFYWDLGHLVVRPLLDLYVFLKDH